MKPKQTRDIESPALPNFCKTCEIHSEVQQNSHRWRTACLNIRNCILYKQQDEANNGRFRWKRLKYSLWVSWGIGRSDHYVQQDYIQVVPAILHENLQREAHKSYGPPASVTWLQLLRKQTNTDTSTALNAETHWSKAHNNAHSPSVWHQPGLANVTCAWSWILCRTTPAILTAKIIKVTSVNCNFGLKPVSGFHISTRMFLYSHS